MAVCEIHLGNQNVLRKMTSCTVILPENAGPGPFPVFYLLHGLSDNHTVWVRRTSLERYVEGLPWIVVMPDGGRGWYTDSSLEQTSAVETFIMRDLLGFIERTFQARTDCGGRVIAGLSMGGFGAVKLALKYPGMFCAAASHSGAFVHPGERKEGDLADEMRRIFGQDLVGGPDDVYALAERMGTTAELPALYLDCGTEDYLLEHNRRFHRHLEAVGVAHEYAEHSGAHSWSYWDEHIRGTISRFAEVLGSAAK